MEHELYKVFSEKRKAIENFIIWKGRTTQKEQKQPGLISQQDHPDSDATTIIQFTKVIDLDYASHFALRY